ncbi:hypothetical protein [Rhabdothermincola sediminis]|uniref:hypothetical protein n=1 Tax=Rhabdothermincola sediminis TaxID=2751370 RepID=UPI001AA09096|nr:hypothetical protein [Rhabdothermincola sediminis]
MAIAAAILAAGLGIAPVGAAPPAPTLVGPADGSVPTSNPVLSWNAVAGAVKYQVQVSTNPTFSSTVYSQTTYNLMATPPADLAQVLHYWRVRAYDAANAAGPFSDTWTFTKTAPNGPEPIAPLSGATLTYPDDALIFEWSPLSGAKTYEIQIDTEDQFTAPITVSATTSNTSYSVSSPQTVGQTYYWRVRAKSAAGVPTLWSTPQSYSMDWPEVPQGIYPPDTNSPSIDDVVLAWTPAKGASAYDLQVSSNINFTNNVVVNATNIKSTQYSPSTTLNNGAYYWRVRAKNVSGVAGPWSPTRTFTRSWPAPELTSPPSADPPPGCLSTNDFTVVQLCLPANGSALADPQFTWTPVKLASRYQLQISPSPTFSSGNVSFTTNQTSYTLTNLTVSSGVRRLLTTGACAVGDTCYWRVRPLDDPVPVNGIWSATGSFVFQPDMVRGLEPADTITTPVDLPVLRWTGEPGATSYTVTIERGNGTVAETATTASTSYVPQTLIPSDGPFTWYVQRNGGPATHDSLKRRFTLNAAPPSVGSFQPLPAVANPSHTPVLTWRKITGATRYEIWAKAPGSGTFSILTGADDLTAPGFAYPSLGLTQGIWEWYVKAYNGTTLVHDGVAAKSTFGVLAPNATTLVSPVHCSPDCTGKVYETPTLRWDPVPGYTGRYQVQFARDINFTNVISSGTVNTYDVSHTPTLSLADSQAGQAIYWYARPIDIDAPEPGSFATDPNSPVRAFRKESRGVELLAPRELASTAPAPGEQPGTDLGPDDRIQNGVIFRWRDYLLTNQSPTSTADKASQAAERYRIQISTRADFATILDSATVDQTSYVAPDMTYPDGPLYWRVQALDASDNYLTWSQPGVFDPATREKRSPVPTQTAPANGAEVFGVPVLRWAPQLFALGYDVEIYKNVEDPNQVLVTANRVFSGSTNMTAIVPNGNLPAGTYGWRIRRFDADSRKGPWSAPETNGQLRTFTIRPEAPALVAPADGANVPGSALLLEWSPVANAAQYRVDIATSSSFSPVKETVTTSTTSFAPVQDYPNGVYFWRVASIDSGGAVLGMSETWTFVKGPPPPPDVWFNAMSPVRILDSRPSGPQVGPYGSPWGAGTTRDVTVAGVGGVPPDADAVVLNVTVTSTTQNSFLTIWPKGADRPTASSLNWQAGWTVPNAVTVKVGTGGKVSVFNNRGNVDVIFDVVGYYRTAPAAGFTSLTPVRIQDSRPSGPQVGPYGSPWGAGTSRDVVVAGGTSPVPADATAVVLNATVTNTTASSYLTIWPKGQPRPLASSLNWQAGWTIPNAVTVQVGSGGQVSVFNNRGNVDVIFDVVGYFKAGTGKAFHPVAPVRIQDSRPESKVGPYSTPWGAGTSRDITVKGDYVPNIAEAVLLNVTVTATTDSSFLTVWPSGSTRPLASSLNWQAGWTIPNAVTARIGSSGKVSIFNNRGSVHVIADVSGWYG